MTINGFGILLILVKKRLREIRRKLGKNLNKPPVGFGKNKLIDTITTKEEC